MNRRGQGLALAGTTALISGVAVAINGFGVRAFGDATTYTTVKNLVAGVVLTAVGMVAARQQPATAPRRPATRGGWMRLVAIAVIGGSVPFVLFFEGLSRSTAADAAFLHKTLVVWVALLAVPLLGERLGRLQVAAVAVLVVAQLVLVGGLPELAAGSGELLILGATLLWAVEVVVAKQVLREVTPATVAVARMGVGSVVLVVWTLGTRGAAALIGISATQAAWALLTGVVLAGYVATWLAALSRAPAVDVTAVLVGGAVLTALIDAARGTLVLAPLAPGLLLLLFGVALAVAGSLRRPTLS